MAVRNLPDDTTNGIAAINNALATGAISYPGATQVYNKETGLMFVLSGVGTAARFVSGAGAANALSASQVQGIQRVYTGQNSTGLGSNKPAPVVQLRRANLDNVNVLGNSAQNSLTTNLGCEVYLYGRWSDTGSSARLRFVNGSPVTTGVSAFRIFASIEFKNKLGGTGTGTVVIPLTFQGAPSAVMPATPGAVIQFDNPAYPYTEGDDVYIKWQIEHPTNPGVDTITYSTMAFGNETNQEPSMFGPPTAYYSGAIQPPGAYGGGRLSTKYGTAPFNTARFAAGFCMAGVWSDDRRGNKVTAISMGDSLLSQNQGLNVQEALALMSGVQITNMNAPGSNSGTFPDTYRSRMYLADGEILLLNHGHNSTSQAAIQNMWRWAKGKFKKVVHIGASWDVATTASNWNDKSKMTLVGAPVTYATISAYNAWVKTQVGTLYGPDEFYDFASMVRDPADNLFYVDGTGLQANAETGDGVHVNTVIGVNNAVARMVAANWHQTLWA